MDFCGEYNEKEKKKNWRQTAVVSRRELDQGDILQRLR